jgi:NADPH:quinone reductase-like Zn-dependent oxidoreductase
MPRCPKSKRRKLIAVNVRVQACSVNPIDTKVRNGTYDDAPGTVHLNDITRYHWLTCTADYYQHVKYPFHIIGFDGAGIVEEVGPDCVNFKPGDKVFYVSNTVREGTTTEYQLVNESDIGHKPKSMDFVEAAAMPLTYGTAYESLVERMEIKKGENVGILIINGAGGVGAMASQIARWVLELPVVITTASRPETVEFTKKMGATHVVNHRMDLKKQVDDLKLDVPIK